MAELAYYLAAFSVLSLLASVLLVPWFVGRLPADYFTREERTWTNGETARVRRIGYVLKNVLGWIFVIAGLLMLALPGQGILTILVGLTLVDFPGKFELERRLVRRRPVHKALNWIRRKRGREPLIIEDEPT